MQNKKNCMLWDFQAQYLLSICYLFEILILYKYTYFLYSWYYCYGPGLSDCTSKLSDYEPDVDYPHLLELAELTILKKEGAVLIFFFLSKMMLSWVILLKTRQIFPITFFLCLEWIYSCHHRSWINGQKRKFMVMARNTVQLAFFETTEALRAETTDLKERLLVPGP